MSIAARFAPVEHDERRRATRHHLRLGVTGQFSNDDPRWASVLNISASGMLLECLKDLAAGESFSVELPEAGTCHAVVVWADAPMFGCRFAQPLTEAALAAARLAGEAEGDRDADDSPGELEDFGERLHRLRSERGLSLGDIADRLGVSKPTVWAWEHGKSRPIERRLSGLAEVLGVTPAGLQPAPPSQDEVVARHRRRIAEMYGVDPERVRIMIDL